MKTKLEELEERVNKLEEKLETAIKALKAQNDTNTILRDLLFKLSKRIDGVK